jgi:hypothetical protein
MKTLLLSAMLVPTLLVANAALASSDLTVQLVGEVIRNVEPGIVLHVIFRVVNNTDDPLMWEHADNDITESAAPAWITARSEPDDEMLEPGRFVNVRVVVTVPADAEGGETNIITDTYGDSSSDSVGLIVIPTVSVESSTWGAIKSLYR